ncbi:putative cyclin [Monocercomonoides exilis]|uniref:putative cyclin n=1 Tax=Monocercomonoides exilis TaxID=2049356 RepID=UPI00355A1BD1|nr:putative cyclin [Monocercomonoides exilis]|eukprot:MONOS_9700.1-p1 / transcript=MONOS_9700.1 / gene=MONOS_9700 / organism=Monocercomonoides_exilis_PA203 / gene_product=cyclin, Nterminal domain containing protein / transcript_product=cyclin, Nterminal domain containing protein / location=Mono_scaffold00410:38426-39356(+) / protein_length=242 / sequence_SO=supercontig / SO=protein_coding / is_pseudo=false
MIIRLELGQTVRATAFSFFYHFFLSHTDEKFPFLDIAQAAVFLSSKCEETPRTMKDIINVSRKILYPEEEPLIFDERYFNYRASILCYEQVLLRSLNFEFSICHPHSILFNLLHSLHSSVKLCALSLSILNDSYHLPLCVIYKPEVIACGCIFLAAQLLNEEDTLTQSDDYQQPSSSLEQLSGSSSSPIEISSTSSHWHEVCGVTSKQLLSVVTSLTLMIENEHIKKTIPSKSSFDLICPKE